MKMPLPLLRSSFLVAVLLAMLLMAMGCKKAVEDVSENILEQYFEQNILNRDFIVKYASDSSVDITSGYEGYVFRLFKNTLYDGPMTGIKIGITFNGTWSSNADYGKLVITFPPPGMPQAFTFLSRQWRFTKKAIPVMELAPWGTSDPKILHMERQ